MRCPCCGEETDKPFVIVHTTIYRSDGTKLYARPNVIRYFTELLKGPVPVPEQKRLQGTFTTTMAHLRKFIQIYDLPYELVNTRGKHYELRRFDE